MQPEYATREDLKEFKVDIVDDVDKKLDLFKISIAEQNKSDMATWREIIRDDFKIATEIMSGKMDALEKRIDEKIITRSYFEEYMGDFQKKLLKKR